MLKGEYDYKKDKEKGDFGENNLAEMLKKRVSYISHMLNKNNSEFDIKIIYRDDTNTKIEVKTDSMTRFTGNCAVEIFSRKENSGLRVTRADYWAFAVVIKDEKGEPPIIDFWIIPTSILRETVKLKNLGIRVTYGGDKGEDGKGTSLMYLVPFYLIEKDAVYVNDKRFLKFKRER